MGVDMTFRVSGNGWLTLSHEINSQYDPTFSPPLDTRLAPTLDSVARHRKRPPGSMDPRYDRRILYRYSSPALFLTYRAGYSLQQGRKQSNPAFPGLIPKS